MNQTDTPMVDALIAEDAADPTANIGRRIRHMIALAITLEREVNSLKRDRAVLIELAEAVRSYLQDDSRSPRRSHPGIGG